jgi:hypothetical protein
MLAKTRRSAVGGDELERALRQFEEFWDGEFVDELQPCGGNAVYTTSAVVWLLIYQRLQGNASLERAVAEYAAALRGTSSHRRVVQGTLSSNTGSYSRARSRLELATARRVCDVMCEKLVATTAPSFEGRRVYVLDGTTITLPSEAALRRAFPPAQNQHGQSHWPVCQLLVAHEVASGCAIRPEWGAMYGEPRVSELTLALRLLERIPPHSVLLADRNFGVFAYVYAAVSRGHDVVVRMTEQRFKSLRRAAQPCGPGEWRITWQPSRWDRQQHAELPAGAAVDVRLLKIAVNQDVTLLLAVTFAASAESLAALYHQRQQVETDIRDVKLTLKLDRLTSRSVAMVEKELTLAMVAYNLVVQVRRLASQQAGVPPRRISFRGTWTLVTVILLRDRKLSADEWRTCFAQVLRGAGQRKLPNRPQRSYPRKIWPRGRQYPERPLNDTPPNPK